MSGHESHGHGGGHGDHGHGHKKEKPKPVTDELMNELASKIHLSDESEALRKSLASGKLTPELEKEAAKRIDHEDRDKYINQLARDRMLRIIKNTKKSKEILDKKIEDLEDALLEHGSAGSFRDLIEAKKKDAEHERDKLEEILEKNTENIADMEAIKRLDETRSEYAKEFKKYHKGIKTEKRIDDLKIGIFNTGTRIKNFFRKSDSKKDLLDKKDASEYETPEFKAKKEAYEVARLVLANRMYERRKQELMYVGAKTREDAIKEIKKNSHAPNQHVITKDEAVEALKLEKKPEFKLKTREIVISEMKRESPSVFKIKTREAIIGEMLSEYEKESESRGYSREEIQEQLIEQEDRFRLGKYNDEIDARIEKELNTEIASGKYDAEINKRIAEDEKKQIDEYNNEQDDLIAKGKYDKEIEKRIKDSEAAAKEAKEKFESELGSMIENGHYDSEIERIRLESGKLDPAEQIKRLKQYKAKEILQKTFFDERRKVYEESGVPEKVAALRLWEWYAKQPRWKKIALSTALFTAGGATGAIPFAAGMIAKYGILSYAGMRFGTSAFIGGVVANGVKGIDLLNHKKDEDFKKEQARKRKESEDQFVNGEINQKKHEENLLFIEEDENKAKKKRMRAKAAVGVLLGAGVGAGAYHIIGDMMPADHDNVPPPMTKGLHITKEPEKVIVNTEKAPIAPEPTPVPPQNTPAQINPENGQGYNLNQMPPREPAGPEIIMNPHREILERGGPAITSDVTPHTTADGIGAKNANIQDHTPSAEKPKYNFGEPESDKKINPVNESSVSKYPGLDKMLDEADKNRDPFNGKYVSDAEHFRGTGSGTDIEYKDAVKSAYENARAKLLVETNNNTELVKNAKVISTHYRELPNGGYRVDVAMSVDKPVVSAGVSTPENIKLSDQVNPETNKPIGSPEDIKAPKTETPDPNAGKQINPETNKPMDTKVNTDITQNNEGPQTVGEYLKNLNKQSPHNAEDFKVRGNMSDQELKNLLTPSDSDHERIVIKGESPDIATATKSIDFSKSQLKNNTEDFKQITEIKKYQDASGYHFYQVIEIKK